MLRNGLDCEVYEIFVGFRVAEDLTSGNLSDTIQDEMKWVGVDIQHPVAQGYDGDVVIIGKMFWC